MSLLTLVIEVDIETNDQPEQDVRKRLANVPRRVSQGIVTAVRDSVEQATYIAWPESYFESWPENGQLADINTIRMRTEKR